MEAILALAASTGVASWLFNDLFLNAPPSPMAYNVNASSGKMQFSIHIDIFQLIPMILAPLIKPLALLLATTLAIFLMGTLLSTKLSTGRWAPRRMTKTDWQQQLVVITGGSGGVGRALCEQLCEKGAQVVSLDLNPAGLKHPNFTPWRCDVSYPEDIQTAAAYILNKFPGHSTILINCAGLHSTDPRLIVELEPEQVLRSHGVNSLSSYWTLRSFLPKMLLDNDGHVVIVSSIMAHVGVPRMADYVGAKAATVALYETLLREIRLERKHTAATTVAKKISPHGVQASLVLPAHINTTMFPHWKYPFPFSYLTPSLSPEYVAKKIIDQIASRRSSRLYLPRLTQITRYLDLMPIWMKEVAQWLAGTDHAVEGMRRRELERLKEAQTDVDRIEVERDYPETQVDPTSRLLPSQQSIQHNGNGNGNGNHSSFGQIDSLPSPSLTNDSILSGSNVTTSTVSPLKIRKRTSTSQPSLGAIGGGGRNSSIPSTPTANENANANENVVDESEEEEDSVRESQPPETPPQQQQQQQQTDLRPVAAAAGTRSRKKKRVPGTTTTTTTTKPKTT